MLASQYHEMMRWALWWQTLGLFHWPVCVSGNSKQIAVATIHLLNAGRAIYDLYIDSSNRCICPSIFVPLAYNLRTTPQQQQKGEELTIEATFAELVLALPQTITTATETTATYRKKKSNAFVIFFFMKKKLSWRCSFPFSFFLVFTIFTVSFRFSSLQVFLVFIFAVVVSRPGGQSRSRSGA